MTDHEFFTHCLEQFSLIGGSATGGFTRLGYSKEEDEMHRALCSLAHSFGLEATEDSAGNTIVFEAPAANTGYTLIGSHLDSVVDGGNYDGVAGVIAGLWVLWKSKQEKKRLPARAIAFRCEESSNFGVCTVGSSLFVGQDVKPGAAENCNRDGKSLVEIFDEKGLSFVRKESDPCLENIEQYLELHIEQGRVLQEKNAQIGVVTSIAGCCRVHITLVGFAEHSGTTPMNIRQDALCAAAELILRVEKLGRDESACGSQATVGVLNNYPNAMNTIPGRVELSVDMRSNGSSSLNRMQQSLRALVSEISSLHGMHYTFTWVPGLVPAPLSAPVLARLQESCEKAGLRTIQMTSGAGHDAAVMASVVPAGMLFVPCKDGISHNPKESADTRDILQGAQVLYRYLSG